MNELLTNKLVEVNEYKPTPAELRLLEVMINPEFAGKTVTDKCKAAECTTPVYYAALKKPGFMALVRESAIDLVKDKLVDVVNATVKFAVSTAQNHQDRRILLEMAGLYREKTDLNINPDEPLKAMIATMSDSDILQKIKEFAKEHPEIMEDLVKNEE